ncbi:MAG TPA: YcxB family protein [Pyrinomonadaceae bacterium]|nr:YcxB family protein [Pyrinomonadaceae bacterium]
MEAVTVRYKLSEKEYMEASRLIFSPNAQERKFRVAVAVVLSALAFPLLFMSLGLNVLVAILIGLAFVPLLLYVARLNYLAVARRCYRGDGKFREAMAVTLTDEHITVQSKNIDSKLGWKLYTDVLEGESCYVLVYGRDLRMMTVVPKRAFQSKRQHLAFRELMGAQFNKRMPVQQIGEHATAATDAADVEYQPKSFQPPDWR